MTGPARAAHVVGAILKLTSVGRVDSGWLTLFPAAQGVPATSTVNVDTHAYAIANSVIVGLGTGGQVCVNIGRSSSNVIIDITGLLANPSSAPAVRHAVRRAGAPRAPLGWPTVGGGLRGRGRG